MKTIQQLLVLSATLALVRPASAAVPSTTNYQGRLTNAAGVPLPGNRAMSVKIYDSATEGALLYSEAMGNVTVDPNGVYGFQFGANGIGPPANLASALPVSNEHWLELMIDGVAQAPRQKLLAVPFALVAKSLPDGTVTTSMVANGAVDFNQLSPGVMASLAAGTATNWGSITGSISAQPDLTSALNGKVANSTTVNGAPLSGNVTLGKADVGLSSVDNTSDANKPVSALVSTALGLKVDLSQLSATGGPNKVPQLTANGSISLMPGTISGDALISGDGAGGYAGPAFYLGDLGRLWFLNTARSGGGSIFYHTSHDVHGGELQINGDHRIALCLGVNGALQLGLSRQSSKQYVYLQDRGNATAGSTTSNSIPLYFNANYWNGSAVTACPTPKIQAVPNGTTGDVFLNFYNPATKPNESGGDGTATLAMQLSKNGLALPTQTIADANAVITKPLGDARYKALFSKQNANRLFAQSSTALQSTDISIMLVAGVTYCVEIVATYNCTDAAHGVLHRIVYSGTLATIGGDVAISNSSTPQLATPVNGTTGADGSATNPIFIQGGGNLNPLVHSKVVYTAITGGTLSVQAAQAVAGASDLTLRQGSWLIATPLAP